MEELLDLAIEDPAEGRRRALAVLSSEDQGALARSYAHHCLGIVYRDEGRVGEALTELRRAVEAARGCDTDRESDVRATLGTTLVFAGRTNAGLRQLDRAAATASGEAAAKVVMRKAGVLGILGRYRESADSASEAVAEMGRLRNPLWEARSRVWLGHAYLGLGAVDRAEEEVAKASETFRRQNLHFEHLTTIENQAEIAAVRGDVVGCLRLFERAMSGYRDAGQHPTADLITRYAEEFLRAVPGVRTTVGADS